VTQVTPFYFALCAGNSWLWFRRRGKKHFVVFRFKIMQAGDTENLKDNNREAAAWWLNCQLINPEIAPCIRPNPEVMLHRRPQM